MGGIPGSDPQVVSTLWLDSQSLDHWENFTDFYWASALCGLQGKGEQPMRSPGRLSAWLSLLRKAASMAGNLNPREVILSLRYECFRGNRNDSCSDMRGTDMRAFFLVFLKRQCSYFNFFWFIFRDLPQPQRMLLLTVRLPARLDLNWSELAAVFCKYL